MTDGRGAAMARMAESMLRTLGGCEVQLWLPICEPTDTTVQRLGLTSTGLEAVPCSPVVVRSLSTREGEPARYELLFAASTILLLAETRAIAQAELLTTARGVVCGDKRMRIESLATEYFAGTPYLYRVTARPSDSA